MFDFITKTKKLILLVGDVLALYGALYLTLMIRYSFDREMINWERNLWSFSFIFVIWLGVFFINESYDLKISYNTSNLLSSLIRMSVINGALAVAIFYFLSPVIDTIKPQRILLIDLALSIVWLFVWRKIFFHFIKSSKIANRVLIIGQTPLAAILAEEIKRRPQLGYVLIDASNLPNNLKEYCSANHVDILVSAFSINNNESAKKIFDCLSLGVDVYNINGFFELITNKIPVEYIEHSWFLENLNEHSKKLYEIIKRLTDILLILAGLVPAALLTPLIALIIKLENPGPIIFKQIRTGKNGREFLAMKFRSMVANAEKNGPQWATQNDPRVTRFGSLMRKTRLDEIPQLINILKGEMSFVGPRPERPEFVSQLAEAIPFYRERLLVKPGLTGWAQLNGPAYGGSQEETLEKIKYDLYYVKNRSFILDLSIILKTIKVVLGGRGQ